MESEIRDHNVVCRYVVDNRPALVSVPREHRPMSREEAQRVADYWMRTGMLVDCEVKERGT